VGSRATLRPSRAAAVAHRTVSVMSSVDPPLDDHDPGVV
jgi:hypothetical protein